MDPLDRLAAYLDGDLDRDEHAAVEAELAADVELRAQLEALRRAEAALSGVDGAELPEGFETRLRTRLDEELAARYERDERSVPAASRARGDDELAGRRSGAAPSRRSGATPSHRSGATSRRGRAPNWGAIAGFAAALAVVALVGVNVVSGGFLGGQDGMEADSGAESAEDAPAQDGGAETMADGEQEATEESEIQAAPPDGPRVRDDDRELDPEDVDGLLAAPALERVAGRGLSAGAGQDLAARFRDALIGRPAAGSGNEDAGRDLDAGQGEAESEQGEATEGRMEDDAGGDAPSSAAELRGGPLAGEDRAHVSRRLHGLLDAEPDALPALVELATFEGEPAIVYGLVTRQDDAYTRPEVWIVAREDCQELRFEQR